MALDDANAPRALGFMLLAFPGTPCTMFPEQVTQEKKVIKPNATLGFYGATISQLGSIAPSS
jgi:hypothetical protein